MNLDSLIVEEHFQEKQADMIAMLRMTHVLVTGEEIGMLDFAADYYFRNGHHKTFRQNYVDTYLRDISTREWYLTCIRDKKEYRDN